MEINAHGSFAFKFETNYTLISVAESWNVDCINIYAACLGKRVDAKPDLRRCVIMDGRKWKFQTPECLQKFKENSRTLTRYYKELFIGYCLAPENYHLSKYIVDSVNDEFRGVIHWKFFLDLDEAVLWLNSEGFEIPPLTDSSFPEPLPATHYLNYL